MRLHESSPEITYTHLEDLKGAAIHFIGVGGIGMSGLAQILFERGFSVSGSDLFVNDNIQRLKDLGLPIFLGHTATTLSGKNVFVMSTAIQEIPPALQEARTQGIAILHRSDILALIMAEKKSIAISGTHGKTTTTGLMGWTLEAAGLDPTVIDGGIMNNWGSNVKLGQGDWCVAEADESDGSFTNLPRQIALITNIDSDHMDYYESTDNLYGAFDTFATGLSGPEALAVICIDDPQCYLLWQKIRHSQPCVSYGVHAEADIQAQNISLTSKGAQFDLIRKGAAPLPLSLCLYGHHNVLNALGVAAVAFACGTETAAIQKAFMSFQGVQRRFTPVGEWKGATIIDDYAHHPVEIRATLAAAKKATQGRVIAVLEPHRYSRLDHHFKDFITCCEEADITIVLPVYAARETPRTGITHQALVEAMKGDVYACDGPPQLIPILQQLTCAGDMVLCLGAGSISSIARSLAFDLDQAPIHLCA